MKLCSTENCCKQLVASCELKCCMQMLHATMLLENCCKQHVASCVLKGCMQHLHATKLHRVWWALR